jgi:hypothetical protein
VLMLFVFSVGVVLFHAVLLQDTASPTTVVRSSTRQSTENHTEKVGTPLFLFSSTQSCTKYR